jgi:hypothetical protein
MKRRDATVAVIGAGDFIGAAITRKFAREGFTVFAGRRNGGKLAALVNQIEEQDGRIVARALDARKENEITEFLSAADSRYFLRRSGLDLDRPIHSPPGSLQRLSPALLSRRVSWGWSGRRSRHTAHRKRLSSGRLCREELIADCIG